MDERRDAANEEGASRERLFRVLLKLMLVRDDALGSELLDLRLAVVVPAEKVSFLRQSGKEDR